MVSRRRQLIRLSWFLLVSWLMWFLLAEVPSYSILISSNEDMIPSSQQSGSFFHPYCRCTRNQTFASPPPADSSTGNYLSWDWCGVESTLRGSHQKVVAFSIYGTADKNGSRYYDYIKNNANRIKDILPGWIMRLYHNTDKDSKEQNILCDVYCSSPWMDLCDVKILRRQLSKRKKGRIPDMRPVTGETIDYLDRMMWRYLPMLDPQVDVIITRDLDADIIDRELAALNEWFNSNYTFHIMRDHQGHSKTYGQQVVPIPGGLFGAKLFQRRDLIDGLTRAMINFGQSQKYSTDQTALAKIFWPSVRHDVMAHDSYNCLAHWNALPTFPFPTKRENYEFVTGNLEGRWPDPEMCPVACRPPNHKDWEYC